MKGLARADKIGAGAGEGRSLCRPRDARKACVALQILLTRLAHLRVRLHAEDRVAVLEEQLAEQSGPRPDVGDDMIRP